MQSNASDMTGVIPFYRNGENWAKEQFFQLILIGFWLLVHSGFCLRLLQPSSYAPIFRPNEKSHEESWQVSSL